MGFSEVRIRAFTAQELCNACGSRGGVDDVMSKVTPMEMKDAETSNAPRTESGDEFGTGDGVHGGDVFGDRNESAPDTMGGNENTDPNSDDEEGEEGAEGDDGENGDDGDTRNDGVHENDDAESEGVEDDIEVMILKFGYERLGA